MKFILTLMIAFTMSFTSIPFAADIGSLAWDRANIDTLHSFGKDAVATFLNEQQRKESLPPVSLLHRLLRAKLVDSDGQTPRETGTTSS